MKKLLYKEIPNALRINRERLGLTQKQVAQKLGLQSTTIISRWEKGEILPSLINAFWLSRLYRAPLNELFADLQGIIEAQATNDYE
jgi:transcriptional regulator with XRE-family HTH domain